MSHQTDGTREKVLNINVGILGHVDSGKTSLVKALSTSLSTAALDKHPQSQQRGITLDLGFSSFSLNIPDRIRALLSERGEGESYDTLQFTLVDCPGHSSLIRTIIGGAQIIDMIILVVDANKGIQTQTAECIVIGEITTDNIIIALNKIDMLPEEDRAERIEKISRRIQKTLSTSKFAHVKIVPISATVGGEKVAAISSTVTNATSKTFKSTIESVGVTDLVDEVINTISLPIRNPHVPFYFAIDHCFPIKGHGTVVTGTVLNGSVSVNQMIEFPYIHEQRKVKSMQMFHKPIKCVNQGDRVGICVTNLDSNQIERGIAAAPNSLPLVKNAVCMVKKIRYFRLPCKSDTKFHISIGHSTVLAHVTFFGGSDLNMGKSFDQEPADLRSSVLQPVYEKSFPRLSFNKEEEYLLQDEILSTEDAIYGNESVQFALIQFQQPIYCPMSSLMIGSRLDSDTTDVSNMLSQQCRLCFYGPLKEVIHDQDVNKLKIFYWKHKECEVHKITDARNGLCYEAIGWKLVTEGGSIHAFLGMKLSSPSGVLGTIVSPFGSDGHFRVKFPNGARIYPGSKLKFRFKRYIFDKNKRMEQNDNDEEILKALNIRDAPDEAIIVEVPFHDNSDKKKTRKNTKIINQIASGEGSTTDTHITTTIDVQTSNVDITDNTSSTQQSRNGKIESIKTELLNGSDRVDIVIISGAFKIEENIRLFVGNKVVNDAGEIGEITGPFGKLGKFKASFVNGCTSKADSTVDIYISSD